MTKTLLKNDFFFLLFLLSRSCVYSLCTGDLQLTICDIWNGLVTSQSPINVSSDVRCLKFANKFAPNLLGESGDLIDCATFGCFHMCFFDDLH